MILTENDKRLLFESDEDIYNILEEAGYEKTEANLNELKGIIQNDEYHKLNEGLLKKVWEKLTYKHRVRKDRKRAAKVEKLAFDDIAYKEVDGPKK